MSRRRPSRLTVAVLTLCAAAGLAGPAAAQPCRTCDLEPIPGGGGGRGGGGGGGSTVGPVTVTGTFRYADRGPAGGGTPTLRPIAGVAVEVWRFAPHVGPIWTWAAEMTTTTDAGGHISASFPFGDPGFLYALRVTATNDAAAVWPMDSLALDPFYSEPGSPDGAPIRLLGSAPGVVLDFSYDYTDAFTPQHFNLAEDLRHARAYAVARRDPGETEPIPAVRVQPTNITSTWFDAPHSTVVINGSDVFNDHVVLHEYAHALEAQIGSLPWWATQHDGCLAKDLFGAVVNSGGHAWMEGFADYFAQAVDAGVPGAGMVGDGSGTFTKATLEQPGSCPSVPAGFTPDTVELFVAGTLWDLFDAPADSFAAFEPADTIARTDMPGGTAIDTHVFQIMDRELDTGASGLVGTFPTILDFRNAWRNRGLPAGLDSVMVLNGIPVPTPAPPTTSFPATTPPPTPPEVGGDLRMCAKKPYLPQCP